MLCERCAAFDIQCFPRRGYPYRGYSLENVLESAADGCSFCTLLYSQLRLAEEIDDDYTLPDSRTLGKSDADGLTSALTRAGWWFGVRLRGIRHAACWVHFSVTRGGGDGESELPDGRDAPLGITSLGAVVRVKRVDSVARRALGRLPPAVMFNVAAEPGTPAHLSGDIAGHIRTAADILESSQLELVRKWHQNCRSSHPQCNKSMSGAESIDPDDVELPTRCLEIRRAHDGLSVRICKTGGQRGKYIALSHRWLPEVERVKTLRANYPCRSGTCDGSTHDACPPFDSTALFRDAYEVAFALGVKYVWIDSMCIIQDDASDWERESLRMADYYQRSWLTISGTQTNSFGGLPLVVADSGSLAKVTRLPYRDQSGEQRGFFYVQSSGAVEATRDYSESVVGSELLSRGWVYQEWVLSRRILTFTPSRLFVTCPSGSPQSIVGERVADSVQAVFREGKGQNILGSGVRKSSGIEGQSVEEIHARWGEVVQSYSRLGLTNVDEDRIVALAGVASEHAKMLGSLQSGSWVVGTTAIQPHHYISGLWTCPRTLLWERTSPGPSERVPGFPTWSWASLRGPRGGDKSYAGMEVAWPGGPGRQSKLLCELQQAIHVPVEKNSPEGAWSPVFKRAGESRLEDLDRSYGNGRRFFVLELECHMRPAEIHGDFEGDDDVEAVAVLTGQDRKLARETWRRVTLPELSQDVFGYADLDNVESLRGEAGGLGSGPVYALFVARVRTEAPAFVMGRVGAVPSLSLQAYQVLYVQKISVPVYASSVSVYERLGAGCLFGDEVDASYRSRGRDGRDRIRLV